MALRKIEIAIDTSIEQVYVLAYTDGESADVEMEIPRRYAEQPITALIVDELRHD